MDKVQQFISLLEPEFSVKQYPGRDYVDVEHYFEHGGEMHCRVVEARKWAVEQRPEQLASSVRDALLARERAVRGGN